MLSLFASFLVRRSFLLSACNCYASATIHATTGCQAATIRVACRDGSTDDILDAEDPPPRIPPVLAIGWSGDGGEHESQTECDWLPPDLDASERAAQYVRDELYRMGFNAGVVRRDPFAYAYELGPGNDAELIPGNGHSYEFALSW